jgi:REP element-mobilizing transposase RayT
MASSNSRVPGSRRLPRSTILPPKVLFHSMWKALNSRFYLRYDWAKTLYLTLLVAVLQKFKKVNLFGFCIMDNHAHKAAELLADHKQYSRWMRDAHSGFGQEYNRRNKRTGPVGNDRPKTVVIRDQEGLKRVMFYQDYNAVAAGIVDHPSKWKWSSYNYYAHGQVNRWTKHLTKPQWYLELADTDEERQRLYREQAAEYWRRKMLPTEAQADGTFAYGPTSYIRKTSRFMTDLARMMAKKKHPRRTIAKMMREEYKALHGVAADWSGESDAGVTGGGQGALGGADPP